LAAFGVLTSNKETITNTIHYTLTDPDLRKSFSQNFPSEMDPSLTIWTPTDKKAITENLMIKDKNTDKDK